MEAGGLRLVCICILFILSSFPFFLGFLALHKVIRVQNPQVGANRTLQVRTREASWTVVELGMGIDQ